MEMTLEIGRKLEMTAEENISSGKNGEQGQREERLEGGVEETKLK